MMGLFSAGNSESKTFNKDVVFNNVDYGESGGGGQNFNVANEGDGNTFNVTDHGAINSSLDFAKSALDNVVSLANSSAENNASLAELASKNGSEKTIGATTKLIMMVLGIGGLTAFAISKAKG